MGRKREKPAWGSWMQGNRMLVVNGEDEVEVWRNGGRLVRDDERGREDKEVGLDKKGEMNDLVIMNKVVKMNECVGMNEEAKDNEQ
ncbi:unnamed protein product [Sphenostylis stenocarpa]|uniref:Uncharacterized protein n=1 Tax=Sphenostylis stenocarpa TaxID=92480 RepID=A0AA86T7W0_9FABA|nr:unnamed protein product [Sphenostylis stenocarpa]